MPGLELRSKVAQARTTPGLLPRRAQCPPREVGPPAGATDAGGTSPISCQPRPSGSATKRVLSPFFTRTRTVRLPCVRAVVMAEHLVPALGGVVVLAVLVNIVELLCTAGFPAIYTRILTLRELPAWKYYGYLLLYNVAYVLDDGLMLTLAVVTLSRRKLQERAGRWLKLVSGSVMLVLGAVLIGRPAWLVW